jgi:hypothetical protein
MWKGVNIMIDDNKRTNDQGTTSSADDTGMDPQGYSKGGEAVEDTDTGVDTDDTSTE